MGGVVFINFSSLKVRLKRAELESVLVIITYVKIGCNAERARGVYR